jgi:hypothetical protein
MAEHDVIQGGGKQEKGDRMYGAGSRMRVAHPPPIALMAVMADARKFMETVKAEEEAERAGETEKQCVFLRLFTRPNPAYVLAFLVRREKRLEDEARQKKRNAGTGFDIHVKRETQGAVLKDNPSVGTPSPIYVVSAGPKFEAHAPEFLGEQRRPAREGRERDAPDNKRPK